MQCIEKIFTALSAYSRIEARAKISDLCFHLKKQERKEKIKSRLNKRMATIRNQWERKWKNSMKLRAYSLNKQ